MSVFNSYMFCYLQRRDIINAGIEPTDSDCEWPSDEEDEEEVKLAVRIMLLSTCCVGVTVSLVTVLPSHTHLINVFHVSCLHDLIEECQG